MAFDGPSMAFQNQGHPGQSPLMTRTITRTSQATIWTEASDFMCAFIAAIVTRSTPALTSSECAPWKQLSRTRVKQSYTSSGSPPPVPSSPGGNPMRAGDGRGRFVVIKRHMQSRHSAART